MLNIISMLWKSHIRFNQLSAHEKEVVTYWESGKGSKFLRVAWNDSQESNSENCRAHKWWSIDNLEREVLCAATRYLYQLWECSVWSRVWSLGQGLKAMWGPLYSPVDTLCQKAAWMGCVNLAVFINQFGASRQVGWIWGIQRKRADGPGCFCSCIWPACRNWTPKDTKKQLLEDFARATDPFPQPFVPL